MKPLHPLSRCEFMVCVRHETASRVLCLALYVNLFGSLGRVVMEPILFNTSDSNTWRSTGLHAIRHIFGLVAVDDFFGRGVILVVRPESGSTPVLMDSWNKSVKTADISLAAYLRARLERPSWPEDDFNLGDSKAFVTLTSLMKPSGLYSLVGTMVLGLVHCGHV